MRKILKIVFGLLLFILSNILFPIVLTYVFGGAVNLSTVINLGSNTHIDLLSLTGVYKTNRSIIDFIGLVCGLIAAMAIVYSVMLVRFVSKNDTEQYLVIDFNSNEVVFGKKVNKELQVEEIKLVYLRI